MCGGEVISRYGNLCATLKSYGGGAKVQAARKSAFATSPDRQGLVSDKMDDLKGLGYPKNLGFCPNTD